MQINFASSLDGRISGMDGEQLKFSNLDDMERVHKIRSESDLILVGRNTINNDDPKLIVNKKYYSSSHLPDVAILDSKLSVNRSAKVFSFPRDVILICGKDADESSFAGSFVSRVLIKKSKDAVPTPSFVVGILGDMGYKKIMIEGGKSVITSFVSEGIWDELTIFFSPHIIGESGVPMMGYLDHPMKLNVGLTKRLGNGYLVRMKK